ncbi:MAG: CBS domain-containing protein [SAR324 cluster bacterium]|uniref:CBS domain-containing protein n=1 Tax=SAR324 cluster bacterium TaxID=2024889 RepID=A0A7X9FUD4_9DELT|nr:CBS domain-containing protein [SAR324 cluster bacterium]
MSVSSVLKSKGNNVFKIAPDDSLSDCITLLNQERIGALLVVERDGRISGIISERDILRIAGSKPFKPTHIVVKDVMTPVARLITATLDESLQEIMERMTMNRIRHIPIMDGDQIAGMISIGDVVKTLLMLKEEENEHMKNYISGRNAVNL